ncbi:MAG: hypothetical protein ABW162_02225 [Candidatus Sedimenticola sp. PURPLELP]
MDMPLHTRLFYKVFIENIDCHIYDNRPEMEDLRRTGVTRLSIKDIPLGDHHNTFAVAYGIEYLTRKAIGRGGESVVTF